MRHIAFFAAPLFALGSIAAGAQSAVPAPPAKFTSRAIAANYGKLPLSFEANRGQTDPQVKFLSRGSGYSLFLTDKSAVLALTNGKTAHRDSLPLKPRSGLHGAPDSLKTDVVRMELVGSANGIRVEGAEELPGSVNYFVGNDPAKWQSNLPTYARVKYSGVYPGVDLVYYGNQSRLEYDFIVAPGANAKPVRLHFARAEKLKLNADGDLTVTAKNGEIAFHKPVVYQMKDGQREPVEGRFTLLAKNTVGFAVGNYDHERELVIDPILVYSTYLGAGAFSAGSLIAVGDSGYTYIAGNTSIGDFPTTAGAFQSAAKYPNTVFVAKLNPAGSAVSYATYLGGNGGNSGYGDNAGETSTGIAIDAEGDAYISGYTSSPDFPTTSGAYDANFMSSGNGGTNGFITKLNPSGTGLLWSTFLGNLSVPVINGIALDRAENVYVTGSAHNIDPYMNHTNYNYPTTVGSWEPTLPPTAYSSPFVTKLNSSGSALVYSTFLGGKDYDDRGLSIAVDGSGHAYVAGIAFGPNFPVTPHAFQPMLYGSVLAFNYFISKLNPDGSALVYSTYVGGADDASNYNDPVGLAIDGLGNAYLGGTTFQADFPVTGGAFQKTLHDESVFITKLNPMGTALIYSTFLGGTQGGKYPNPENSFGGIAVDQAGHVYVTGSTVDTDFPVTPDAFQSVNKSENGNAFLTEFNVAGSAPAYSTLMGGSGGVNQGPNLENAAGDRGYSVAVDPVGNAFVYGGVSSPNFPVTPGAYRVTNIAQGDYYTDTFIAKFTSRSTLSEKTWTIVTANTNPQASGQTVTFTAAVSPEVGSGTPSGTVHFTVDGVSKGGVELDDNGHATYSTSSLPVGKHDVTATYLGESLTYAASNGGLTQAIIGTVATPTFPAVGGTYGNRSAPPPVVIETSTPGAAIYYTTDGTLPTTSSPRYAGPIPLTALTTTFTAIGVGSGDTNSAPATTTFTISPTAVKTSTAIRSAANPSVLGHSVTFTAVVTPVSGAAPTGTVTFKSGAVDIGTGRLSGGVATFTTSDLTLANHTISAIYTGSATDAWSGQELVQTVEP